MKTEIETAAKQSLTRELGRLAKEYSMEWLRSHLSVVVTGAGWYNIELQMDGRTQKTLAAGCTDIGLHAENLAQELADAYGLRGPKEIAAEVEVDEENARY